METYKIFLGVLLLATTGSSHQIVKRSDDAEELATVVQQLSARVTQLEAERNADRNELASKDRHVAFMVQFSQVHSLPPGVPYKFDVIVLNDGNGYNPSQGVFMAPFTGVYIISAQFFTNAANGVHNYRPLIDIMLNGNTYVRLGFDAGQASTGEDSDSTSFTVKLNAGDRVWATSADATYTLHGTYHTFFSGALLYSL